jgi:PncC family amidohydrolase
MKGRDLVGALGDLLRAQRLTLSLAESCTGGLVGHLMTEAPGSSDYLLGGVIAYHDGVKVSLLGVSKDTLVMHGAVSDRAAREMAEGVRAVLAADIGLSVTGIAGPGGGSADKPVGLVFVALAAPTGTWSVRHVWDGERSDNKARSAAAALDLLRTYLEGSLS